VALRRSLFPFRYGARCSASGMVPHCSFSGDGSILSPSLPLSLSLFLSLLLSLHRTKQTAKQKARNPVELAHPAKKEGQKKRKKNKQKQTKAPPPQQQQQQQKHIYTRNNRRGPIMSRDGQDGRVTAGVVVVVVCTAHRGEEGRGGGMASSVSRGREVTRIRTGPAPVGGGGCMGRCDWRWAGRGAVWIFLGNSSTRGG